MDNKINASRSVKLKVCPEVDFDPFSDENLKDPFPAYAKLRKLAPIVKLTKYNCYAAVSYEALDIVLNDWESFSSARGVGIDNYYSETPWRPKSIILEVDPPDHDITRRVLNRVMSRPAMEKMRKTFADEAEELVSRLVLSKEFDGIKDLAEIYPLKVFPDAVGLNKVGRENLLAYGTLVFNAAYPRNQHYEESAKNSEELTAWILSQCSREALTADGIGAKIYEAADKGEVTKEQAGLLVRSLLSAGVDTTINGIGNALYCFARFPQQWQLLKQKPELARGSIDEILRFEGAVMNFFRTTIKQVELCGYEIPSNQKILTLFSSANRDSTHWPNADSFDISRNVKGHLGFGGGIHTCVGQMVARLEVELILTELIKHVETIELAGPPVRRLNNALRGLVSLPLKIN